MKRCWGCGLEVDAEEYALNGGYCDSCKEANQMEYEYMEKHGIGDE